MGNFYTDLFEIKRENHEIFLNDRKKLNTIEMMGLELALTQFVKAYEEKQFGETYSDITQYIRYLDNGIDVLDGVTDTYIFDHYAFGDLWCTSNGIIMMSAVDLDNYTGDDEQKAEAIKDTDILERPIKFDIWSDFRPVLFRLS